MFHLGWMAGFCVLLVFISWKMLCCVLDFISFYSIQTANKRRLLCCVLSTHSHCISSWSCIAVTYRERKLAVHSPSNSWNKESLCRDRSLYSQLLMMMPAFTERIIYPYFFSSYINVIKSNCNYTYYAIAHIIIDFFLSTSFNFK